MIITESTDVQISPTSPIMLLFSILISGPGSNPELFGVLQCRIVPKLFFIFQDVDILRIWGCLFGCVWFLSWSDIDYAFLVGILPCKWYCGPFGAYEEAHGVSDFTPGDVKLCPLGAYEEHMVSVFSLLGMWNFAQLIKVVSRFLHYNLIIPPSIMNKKAFDKI